MTDNPLYRRRTAFARPFMASGLVARYHTVSIQPETVAQHSWRVFTIYIELWGVPPAETGAWLILHDAPEAFTGDVPFPLKQEVGPMSELVDSLERAYWDHIHQGALAGLQDGLSPRDKLRVKICDLLQMVEYGAYRRLSGERLAAIVEASARSAVLGCLERAEATDAAAVREWLRGLDEWADSLSIDGERALP